MSQDKITERFLLVEGSDEKSFIQQFIKSIGNFPNNNTEIKVLEGDSWKQNLKDVLVSIQPECKSILLIMDGDKYSFKDIEQCFNETKLQNPQTFFSQNIEFPDSLIKFSKSVPKFGVYLFPNGLGNGTLEDLCLETIKDDQLFKECVEQFLQCSEKYCVVAAPEYKHYSKKQFQAYYAARMELKYADEIGKASQRDDKSRGFKYLDFSHESFEPLKEFLQKFVG